jgi:hypothetical protein
MRRLLLPLLLTLATASADDKADAVTARRKANAARHPLCRRRRGDIRKKSHRH